MEIHRKQPPPIDFRIQQADAVEMFNEPEVRALVAVVDRLAGRFPGHHRSIIEQVVAEEHLEFDGVPIRDYVPILVEKAATSRLTRARGLAG